MKEKNKESFVRHHSVLSDIIYFIKYYKKYEPLVLIFSVLEIIFKSMLPLIGIVLPKLAVDMVTNGTAEGRAIATLAGFTVLAMLAYGLGSVVEDGKYHYYNGMRGVFISLLFLKSLKVKYEYTERGEIKQLYWKAACAFFRGDWSASSRMVRGTIGLAINVSCFFLYSAVIGNFNMIMLAVIIVLSIINYLIGVFQIRYEEKIRDINATQQKNISCVKSAMGNLQGAKDIKIFGMNSWLIKLRDNVLKDIKSLGKTRAKKTAFYEKLRYALAMVRDLTAYTYLVAQALSGAVTVGEFVLYFGAVTGFSNFVKSIMDFVLELRMAANDTDYFRSYMELEETDVNEGGRSVGELTLPLEIEFRDVSFAYKGVEEENEEEQNKVQEKLFSHFNLRIKPGEKLALVGINGAGKTTLIKLLTGMYDPDEGEILINGINRNEFAREELYKLFSVVFQEELILPFTVGENIAMGIAERVDKEKAWLALEKAGVKSVFLEKGIKLESYMGKAIYNEGVELSGGQKQRLLLARALYKNAPMLILDEPTAALDPIAESEVYESYARYSTGKTSIFISHRLASTRFSDRILMLEGGKIIEEGTHDELMKLNGAYAAMFNVQSSYYREEA